jgi:hypothetical protein
LEIQDGPRQGVLAIPAAFAVMAVVEPLLVGTVLGVKLHRWVASPAA